MLFLGSWAELNGKGKPWLGHLLPLPLSSKHIGDQTSIGKKLIFYPLFGAEKHHRGLKSGPREPKRRTKNGHAKNLVFYEAKRPQGGWREGPRLQIRLEGCEHKGRTRWLLNTNILKMCTPSRVPGPFWPKRAPDRTPITTE